MVVICIPGKLSSSAAAARFEVALTQTFRQVQKSENAETFGFGFVASAATETLFRLEKAEFRFQPYLKTSLEESNES